MNIIIIYSAFNTFKQHEIYDNTCRKKEESVYFFELIYFKVSSIIGIDSLDHSTIEQGWMYINENDISKFQGQTNLFGKTAAHNDQL